ncbi:GNAT family N-acetyltransferase [Robiginitalea sediminis]|uniref:GNAT family N-acetyltransferase n=1 Tax=Robiginitalea sediminis TaxID=1982593 RepID=UPI00130328A5|nr:GNAT family N-acetyltransferase [Robiginitalea sediminis]
MPLLPGGSSQAPLYRWWVVPEYLEPVLRPGYDHFKAYDMDGYAIDLQGLQDAGSYVRKQLKPRLRTSLRSKTRKLEASGSIRYEWLFGPDATQEVYTEAMDALKKMIQARFQERGDQHERLRTWQSLEEIGLDLIHSKRASLFLIYKGTKPIAICFNRHWGPVFSFSIPSYDLEFGNYGMGHILIYKQLEWALKNNYLLFDMGMGPMRYKDEWCNYTYRFNTWIIYRKSSITARVYALSRIGLLRLKNQLKSWKADQLYRRIRSTLKK